MNREKITDLKNLRWVDILQMTVQWCNAIKLADGMSISENLSKLWATQSLIELTFPLFIIDALCLIFCLITIFQFWNFVFSNYQNYFLAILSKMFMDPWESLTINHDAESFVHSLACCLKSLLKLKEISRNKVFFQEPKCLYIWK